jgi:hypothetical protein
MYFVLAFIAIFPRFKLTRIFQVAKAPNRQRKANAVGPGKYLPENPMATKTPMPTTTPKNIRNIDIIIRIVGSVKKFHNSEAPVPYRH